MVGLRYLTVLVEYDHIHPRQDVLMGAKALSNDTLQTISIYSPLGLLLGNCQTKPRKL